MSAQDSFGTLSLGNLAGLGVSSAATGAASAAAVVSAVAVMHGNQGAIAPAIISAIVAGITGFCTYAQNRHMREGLVPTEKDSEPTILRKSNLTIMVGSKLNTLIGKSFAVGVGLAGVVVAGCEAFANQNPLGAATAVLAAGGCAYFAGWITGKRAVQEAQAIRSDVKAIKSNCAYTFQPS